MNAYYTLVQYNHSVQWTLPLSWRETRSRFTEQIMI